MNGREGEGGGFDVVFDEEIVCLCNYQEIKIAK